MGLFEFLDDKCGITDILAIVLYLITMALLLFLWLVI